MRKLILILLPLCILYFLVGGILVWTKAMPQDTFLAGAGIVGGIASVLGLLSFLRPALTRSDIANIEAESLKKLGEVSAEIKELEDARSNAANQIHSLEAQKREMELLVRKASMALFLKEQYAHHEKSIIDHLKKQPDVTAHLTELASVARKMDALEEEIEANENVELLHSIIKSATRRPSSLDAAIESAPPVTSLLLRVIKVYADVFSRAFKLPL